MTTSCHTVSPFAVEIPETRLADLHRRLQHARWPDVLPGADWQHGAALEYVQDLATYWQKVYDWRTHEAEPNALPQFTTTLDGQPIHFLHVRSSQPKALPLLCVHGWPGSIVEFLGVIKPLTAPVSGLAFDLVIPSIPGVCVLGTHQPGGLDNPAHRSRVR